MAKNTLTVDATTENLSLVTAFIDKGLEEVMCPMKVQMQMDIAVEELFVNISNYAYGSRVGKATIELDILDEPKRAVITFIDEGVPYDPLAKKDPDITLSAEERAIGGLGIFMVKKSMDDMTYEYTDGKNILKIVKKF